MAMLGISATSHKTTILPEGGRDFLRRRMMELVGVTIAVAGVLLLMAIFTFSSADPSLNHATGTPPNNLMGLPGAYISDLLARVQRGEEQDAFSRMVADLEPELYAQAIRLAQGNQAKAARWLGVTRLKMREKLTQLGLHPSQADSDK